MSVSVSDAFPALRLSECRNVILGYCFGAPFVMDHLATSDWVIAGMTYRFPPFLRVMTGYPSGAIAHPAFLNESHFQNIKSKPGVSQHCQYPR